MLFVTSFRGSSCMFDFCTLYSECSITHQQKTASCLDSSLDRLSRLLSGKKFTTIILFYFILFYFKGLMTHEYSNDINHWRLHPLLDCSRSPPMSSLCSVMGGQMDISDAIGAPFRTEGAYEIQFIPQKMENM